MHLDLLRFTVLFATLYLAFGVASPFLPAFLAARGLAPEQIGAILAFTQLIRLVSGPAAGRLADHLHALRTILAVCTAAAGVAALAFLPAQQYLVLLAIGLMHAALLAPTTSLADALALGRAARAGAARFEYGWVRGAGSAAFIAGSLVAGQLVDRFGPAVTLACQAALLLLAAATARAVPELVVPRAAQAAREREPGFGDLLRNRAFLLVILVAAPVLGSHAMHDAFAMIAWNAAGITSGTGSVLWSEAVAAEVIVFLWIGPRLLHQIGPAAAMSIAVVAAVIRWSVMAQTFSVVALALVEPLHGLTFALLHLACMRVLMRVVPVRLAASAQAAYAFGIGATIGVLTLLSGTLYAGFGALGFWAMAALAAAALPAVWGLSRVERASAS